MTSRIILNIIVTALAVALLYGCAVAGMCM
jgi:hypothetical protein